MSDKHPNVLAFLGVGLGVMAVANYLLYARKPNDERAWRAYCKEAGLDVDKSALGVSKMLAAKKAYLAACKATRKDDGETLAEMKRYEDMLNGVEELLRVADGVKSAHLLALDASVPVEVRASIVMHWAQEWAGVCGFDLPKIHRTKIYNAIADGLRSSDAEAAAAAAKLAEPSGLPGGPLSEWLADLNHRVERAELDGVLGAMPEEPK